MRSDSTSKKRAILLARVAVTITLLAVLLIWLHPRELLSAMKRTGLGLWVLTVVGAAFFHIILAAKWRLLLNAAGNRSGRIETLHAHCAGLFANMYLPSIIGGDVVRAGILIKNGRNVAATMTGIAADRATDVASLIILAAGGLMFMPVPNTVLELRILGVATGVLCLVVSAAFVFIRGINPERFPPRIGRAISELRKAFDAISQQKTAAFIALSASVSIQAFFILQNVLIAKAIGIQVPAAVWFVAWPLAKIVSLLPVSIGGLGLREGVLIALFAPFGVAAALTVAESLVWQTIMYAVSLLGGLVSLWIGQFQRREQTDRPSLDFVVDRNASN